MNLHVSKDSPLVMPSACRGAMEDQARLLYEQEDREGHAKNGPDTEIPRPGKASATSPIPDEIPRRDGPGGE